LNVPFYGHVKQYHNIKSEIDANIHEVLESGQYVMGPMLKRCEQELAAYHGMKYAVGVGNAPTPCGLPFMALGLARATNASPIRIRSSPPLKPSGSRTPRRFSSTRIQKRIASIPPALKRHHPQDEGAGPRSSLRPMCDMKAIRKIADQAQAGGHRGQRSGNRGARRRLQGRRAQRCRVHQLHHAEKPGTFGDGGAVITNNENIDRVIRKLRNHGSDKRSCHSMGYNSRLDDIHAGVLSAKLKHIDEWNDLRRKWSARYSAGLKNARNLTLPYEVPVRAMYFHLYVVETKRPEHRDALLDFFNHDGIDAKCHYPSPFISRKATHGANSPDLRPSAQFRSQRRLLRLASCVPRAHRKGSGLRD